MCSDSVSMQQFGTRKAEEVLMKRLPRSRKVPVPYLMSGLPGAVTGAVYKSLWGCVEVLVKAEDQRERARAACDDADMDDDAELLAGVLPMAARVETIDVSGNHIGKRGFDALAAAISGGAAPALKTFVFDNHSDDSATLREACKSRGVK